MIFIFLALALFLGLAGGACGFWLVQRRGWFTLGMAVEDGQDTLAFFVEGMRCLSGKSAAPCAKCGYVPGTGASAIDRATARSSLRGGRKEVST